jgi:hypothetical protein
LSAPSKASWTSLATSQDAILARETRVQIRWSTWRAMGLVDVARHVTGCHV